MPLLTLRLGPSGVVKQMNARVVARCLEGYTPALMYLLAEPDVVPAAPPADPPAACTRALAPTPFSSCKQKPAVPRNGPSPTMLEAVTFGSTPDF